MMPPFVVFPTKRIAYFVEVSLYFILSSTTSKLNNELTYDIYILDIEMQGMNGLELAKTIRTNEPNALIIFLTSYSEYVFDVF